LQYAESATLVINDIGRDNGGLGPDVFHLEIPEWYDRNMQRESLPAHDFAHMVRSWLGLQWAGRYLVTWSKTVTFEADRYRKPVLYSWIENTTLDSLRGLEYVDESNLAAPAMHDTENPLTERHWSTHYHRKCTHGSGMHVCSVVCDATFQQILHLAFSRTASRGNIGGAAAARHLPAGQKQASMESIKFCLNCPRSLVPFTIKQWPKSPDTTCHAFIPAAVNLK
jgi:hypothetical protein